MSVSFLFVILIKGRTAGVGVQECDYLVLIRSIEEIYSYLMSGECEYLFVLLYRAALLLLKFNILLGSFTLDSELIANTVSSAGQSG